MEADPYTTILILLGVHGYAWEAFQLNFAHIFTLPMHVEQTVNIYVNHLLNIFPFFIYIGGVFMGGGFLVFFH